MGTEDQKRQSEPPYKGEPKIAPDRGKLRPEDIPPTNGRPEPPSRPSEPPRGRYAMATEDVPAAPNPFEFYPDQIVLYGVKLNQDESPVALPFFDTTLNLQVRKKKGNKPVSPKKMVIAVVYGYAFEGHCYRFDKPKLLIFNRSFEGPAEGCGFRQRLHHVEDQLQEIHGRAQHEHRPRRDPCPRSKQAWQSRAEHLWERHATRPPGRAAEQDDRTVRGGFVLDACLGRPRAATRRPLLWHPAPRPSTAHPHRRTNCNP